MKILKMLSALFILVSSMAIGQPIENFTKKEENEQFIKYIDVHHNGITECTKDKNDDSIVCIAQFINLPTYIPISTYDGEVALSIYNALKQKHIKYQLDRTLVN